jgi:hypothetical protein
MGSILAEVDSAYASHSTRISGLRLLVRASASLASEQPHQKRPQNEEDHEFSKADIKHGQTIRERSFALGTSELTLSGM